MKVLFNEWINERVNEWMKDSMKELINKVMKFLLYIFPQLVVSCLPYFQSCINPLIYVMMSKNIRESIRHIVCSNDSCKCCSRRELPESPSHELLQTNQSHAVTTIDYYRSFGNHKPTAHLWEIINWGEFIINYKSLLPSTGSYTNKPESLSNNKN